MADHRLTETSNARSSHLTAAGRYRDSSGHAISLRNDLVLRFRRRDSDHNQDRSRIHGKASSIHSKDRSSNSHKDRSNNHRKVRNSNHRQVRSKDRSSNHSLSSWHNNPPRDSEAVSRSITQEDHWGKVEVGRNRSPPVGRSR